MPRKAKPSQGGLIPAEETPRWTVGSSDPDSRGNQLHRLYYGKTRQAIGRTPADLARFRQIADHNNARGLAPKPKIQCRADENLPAPKHKTATA